MAALGLHCYARAFSSWGKWGLLSSCGAQASYCSSFSCCRAQPLGRAGFSSCGTQAQWLSYMGLAAPRHVGSSQTRDQTGVPCTARWIPNHWATRETQILYKWNCTACTLLCLSSFTWYCIWEPFYALCSSNLFIFIVVKYSITLQFIYPLYYWRTFGPSNNTASIILAHVLVHRCLQNWCYIIGIGIMESQNECSTWGDHASFLRKWKLFSHVWLFATPWTIQSKEFSRSEYWSG